MNFLLDVPILMVVDKNFILNEGETLLLNCNNDANPRSSYIWKKDGLSFVNNNMTYTSMVEVSVTFVC